MKRKNSSFGKAFLSKKRFAVVEIAIVLCSLFLVATLPAIATEQTMQKVSANTVTTTSENDYVLGVYGNANEDDMIDMRDLTYVKLIFFGERPETKLADAKYDGKINPLDFVQIKLIIVCKEKELTVLGNDPMKKSENLAVTIKKPVNRIVIADIWAYREAEALRALNVADKIVGVTEEVREKKVEFPELCELSGIGKAFGWSPDFEAILDLKPDLLMVMPSPGRVDYAEKLPGVTVLCLDLVSPTRESNPERMMVRRYIFDRKEEAREYGEWHDDVMKAINEQTEGISEDDLPRVVYGGPTDGNKLFRVHIGSTIGQLMKYVPCENIGMKLPEPRGAHPKVDIEWLLTQDPEIIISNFGRANEGGYETDDTTEAEQNIQSIRELPGFASVTAVKEDKVYVLFTITGPGYPINIAYLAKMIYPDLALDPYAIHQEYLDRFQHIDFDVHEQGVFVYPPLE
jgi:iron complex transport system substrate-binding protein